MEAKNKYYRSFLIFAQEDIGYGNNSTPSGYVKIESRDGKGKLNVSIQNLKENDEGSCYKMYILKCDEKTFFPVCIDVLTLHKNRSEVQWDFNPRNVADSGIDIEEFNIAAVVVENKNRTGWNIICPLAAYKDKKIPWRNKLKEVLLNKQDNTMEKGAIIAKRQEVANEYSTEIECKDIDINPIPESNYEEGLGEEVNTEESILSVKHESVSEIYEERPAESENEITDDNPTGESIPDEEDNQNLDSKTDEGKADVPYSPISGNSDMMQERSAGSPELCAYRNNSYCNPQINGNIPEACINCNIKNITEGVMLKDRTIGNKTDVPGMEKFKKSLDMNFEVNDPFGSNRKDYKWWKVNSPVQLNNIFFQCNIKTPLFFNPSVMMSHYKYRYLIVGIYSDRMRKREYIVCGIPGAHGIDDKPFGDMCRWVQVEGNRPRYGAFGYWLVYIDPETGNFLGFN
ncbi:MAG: hypothetical protein N3I35_11905 [Clostridia bacterium]|nr:hypothetical protein [Clostridia bacterium]